MTLMPIFRYCLQHSPVPVIVVHPYQRRLHRKHKRETDPERQTYIGLLKLAGAYSSSDSLASAHAPDPVIPDINIDTPGSMSPDEELMYTMSEPSISISNIDVFPLKHAVTAPPTVDAPTKSDQKEAEKVSPKEKG